VRSKGKDDTRVRATVLAAPEGGRFWLELATAGAGGIASAARLLLRDTAVSASDAERIYVMLAGQDPVEVTPQGRTAAAGRPLRRATPLGTELVRVAAGAFSARLFRLDGTRVWRSDEVPLWGLLKSQSARHSVELIGYGRTGGRSVFPARWAQGNGRESAK